MIAMLRSFVCYCLITIGTIVFVSGLVFAAFFSFVAPHMFSYEVTPVGDMVIAAIPWLTLGMVGFLVARFGLRLLQKAEAHDADLSES